jgi:TatD DNase family protein
MKFRLYDAHNHLQDDRFGGRQEELLAACRQAGLARMVVNGACESDWPQVLALARAHPEVQPSFGYHPWYLHECTPQWRENLIRFLDQIPAAVGEIGLDRWKPGLPYAGQEEVFIAQLRIAADRNLPVSIHCLQAWGRMLEILQTEPRPAVGFLLHSYGGPQEMVESFAALGAYFSLPGYYAHERKERQRATFRQIPRERLLIETDAPDQRLPEGRGHRLTDFATGKPLNHPANLSGVYEFAAALRGVPLDQLVDQVEANFLRLFGSG